MEIKKGKFIVIDGNDGTGKTTQTLLLIKQLKDRGHEVEMADFPQYNTKSAGLVEEYLSGKYGAADEVSPYIASVFYAVDRYDASFKIREWLNQGKIVVSNRWVTANMGNQGCKIDNPLERKAYIDWLNNLEYGLFKIPKPDLNIILHLPAEVSQTLSQKRTREDWKGKNTDIHQNNLVHLQKAEKTYLEIAQNEAVYLIDCFKDGQILSPILVNNLILEKVKYLLNLQDPTKNNFSELDIKIKDIFLKAGLSK